MRIALIRKSGQWLALAVACISLLHAQEEPDRPAGEVTGDMVRKKEGDSAALVFPSPQEIYRSSASLHLGSGAGFGFGVDLGGEAERLQLLPGELRKHVAAKVGLNPATDGPVRFVFALNAHDLPVESELMARRLATLSDPEGYVIKTVNHDKEKRVMILGKSEAALWRALATLAQLFERNGAEVLFPTVEIIDYPQMQRRGLVVDLGGQGFMVGPSRWDFNRWKEFVDWMVDQKLNELWLEFIGSGRLMGNLNMEAGEWIGFPLDLKCHPELVCRDRPIRLWDEAKHAVITGRYTAPNVENEFARDLIDYAQARGVKCILLIGYDYFANQLPYVLGVPANDPANKEANKIYDDILKEIVRRYDNAQGVCLITIENKNVSPSMVDVVVHRAHEARAIINSINPRMEVGMLNDYLEWRPRDEFERYATTMPDDMFQLYSPHAQPQNKSWKRIYGNVVRFELLSQYAWNHVAYIFPDRVKREVQESYINGYRRIVTQAWYADVFKLNYATFAETAWNSTGVPLNQFWDETLRRTFGAAAAPRVRAALEHTRFDIRSDIVSRMILNNYFDRPFRFWDMYTLTNIDGLKDSMLSELQADAQASLTAALEAERVVADGEGREMTEIIINSAERRLFLATSARQLLRALAFEKEGNKPAALSAMENCLQEAEKLQRASVKLGIEYPMATQDDEVIARYHEIQARIRKG